MRQPSSIDNQSYVLWRLSRSFHYICNIRNHMIMVDKRVIEQVLAEQYEELVALQEVDLCARKEED